MNPITTFCSTFVGLAMALSAQPAALLLTPKRDEVTRSGSNGTVLRNITPHSIGVVVPSANGPYSTEKFAPSLAFQTLAGDEDGDGDVHSPDIFGSIDALAVLPYDWDSELGLRPRQKPVTILDCYVSPSVDVGTNVSGAPGLRKGDCGRFARTPAGNGRVEYFVRAEQLIAALGMFDLANGQPLTPDDIDLDAITVSVDRHVFVSFDRGHWLRLTVNGALANFFLDDGGVACIPGPVWTPNARGQVGAVLPNRGIIVFSEAQVNAMVVAAALTDNAGACVPAIVDTESLAIDPNGGVFVSNWGNQALTWPNLLLSGETTTGAGVITTFAGGRIARVNGADLAEACGVAPTDGTRMGLAASGSVRALDALESLHREPCWFVLGSPTPQGLGGAIEVDVGTNLPTAVAWLGFGLGVLPVSPSISFLPWSPNTPCFPELYPAILPNPMIPVALAAGAGNARFGTFTAAASPFFGPGILFQAVTMANGMLDLSTPLTIH